MRSSIVPLVAGFLAVAAEARQATVAYPPLPKTAASAAGFAPSGWMVETQARGDLNRDGLPDLAFVLLAREVSRAAGSTEAGKLPPGPARILAIAFAQPRGGFELVLRDHRFLPRKRPPNGLSQGYMLFENGSLDASGGRLRTVFEYTRGHTTFAFRWQNGAFALIGYDSADVSGGCLTQLSIDFLSSRAKMTAGYIDSEKDQVRWRSLARRPLLTLDRIGNGEDFDPYGLLTAFPLTCSQTR